MTDNLLKLLEYHILIHESHMVEIIKEFKPFFKLSWNRGYMLVLSMKKGNFLLINSKGFNR